MTAIGEFFFNELGHNVYMPLLHCHGLENRTGWKTSNWRNGKRTSLSP